MSVGEVRLTKPRLKNNRDPGLDSSEADDIKSANDPEASKGRNDFTVRSPKVEFLYLQMDYLRLYSNQKKCMRGSR